MSTVLRIAVALWLLAGVAAAKDKKKDKHVKNGAITGWVVDAACAIMGDPPHPGHKGCAEGGVPMALRDERGRLWLAINSKYGSATELLLPYIGRKVRAEGWYVDRKGERLISIAKVELVEAAPAAPASTPAPAKEGKPAKP